MRLPELGELVPRRGGPFSRWCGLNLLRLSRWRVVGDFPNVGKCVAIAAPHTSNWDFVIGIICVFAVGLRVSWLGKHTLFSTPLGPLLRFWGGIPVQRAEAGGVVKELIETMRGKEQLILALSPEGTRKKVDRWKSGFYRIALGANVPIFPVAIDYGKKELVLGPLFRPTGDMERDLETLRAFFGSARAKFPEQY